MHFNSEASLTPLVQADAVIHERHSVRIKALALRAQYADDLRREVQHLPEFLLALAQCLCEAFLLRDIDPYSDEPLERPAAGRGRADAAYMTNRSVRTHDPICDVESAMLGQHRLDLLRDELPIGWMYERDVFRDARRFTVGIQTMNRKQLGRPVLETRSGELPASRVREPLSLCQVVLGLLSFFDVDVDPDPVEDRAIVPSERLHATEE